MTTFDERENAFEAQFAHEQDMRFRAIAHRNRAVGAWAAAKLGKTGADAEVYAKSVVTAGVAKPGDTVIVDKIDGDFRDSNVSTSRDEIEAVLGKLLAEAILAQKTA